MFYSVYVYNNGKGRLLLESMFLHNALVVYARAAQAGNTVSLYLPNQLTEFATSGAL